MYIVKKTTTSLTNDRPQPKGYKFVWYCGKRIGRDCGMHQDVKKVTGWDTESGAKRYITASKKDDKDNVWYATEYEIVEV